jgi:hypothetical protein
MVKYCTFASTPSCPSYQVLIDHFGGSRRENWLNEVTEAASETPNELGFYCTHFLEPYQKHVFQSY